METYSDLYIFLLILHQCIPVVTQHKCHDLKCQVGRCCDLTHCCAVYEEWWFWVVCFVASLAILTCCFYQKRMRRLLGRRNAQPASSGENSSRSTVRRRRRLRRIRGFTRPMGNFFEPPLFDPHKFIRLPNYDEAMAPPPAYSTLSSLGLPNTSIAQPNNSPDTSNNRFENTLVQPLPPHVDPAALTAVVSCDTASSDYYTGAAPTADDDDEAIDSTDTHLLVA